MSLGQEKYTFVFGEQNSKKSLAIETLTAEKKVKNTETLRDALANV